MGKIQSRIIDTPIGRITLTAENGAITALTFGEGKIGTGDSSQDVLLKQAQLELEEYFRGERKVFDVPLNPHGTPFQLEDWRALCEIPYGETATYGEIARRIGRPKAFRAVGMANHVNPISIFIPCHRVIGANGALTGYGGGLPIKRFLLDLEQKYK